MKLKKCNELCHFEKRGNYFEHINPNNKYQIMFVDDDGFNCQVNSFEYSTGKDKKQNIVWQKVVSKFELNKKDFIQFTEDNNNIIYDNIIYGVITNIKGNEIKIQIFDSKDVTYIIKNYNCFNNLEKAIFDGDE